MSPGLSLLSDVAALPTQGHDAEWLRFVRDVLKLPDCYLPAAQEVLRQNRWRRLSRPGENVIGYIKTATFREALKMGLALDTKAEPRVLTTDRPQRKAPERAGKTTLPASVRRTLHGAGLRRDVQIFWKNGRLHLEDPETQVSYDYEGKTPIDAALALLEASKKNGEASGLFDVPDELKYNATYKGVGHVGLRVPILWDEDGQLLNALEERINRHYLSSELGLPVRTGSGIWHQEGSDLIQEYDEGPNLPGWLRQNGSDHVDWTVVAELAVRKPVMAPAVAKALRFRAAGMSCSRAVAMATDKREAQKIQTAWKWIDREWENRIVPLLKGKLPVAVHQDAATKNVVAQSVTGANPRFIPPWETLRRHSHGIRTGLPNPGAVSSL